MTATGSSASDKRFDEAAAAQMETLLSDLGKMYQERNEALREVVAAHQDTLYKLALAAEYKDDDTGVHIVRIGVLAEALALALGQSRTWSAMLRRAAPMHDIGKIGIPDAILKKPGSFTSEERAVMNTHSAIGGEILGQSRVPLFQMASEIALSHHERFDGNGYPKRLAGTDIPLVGRIVAVVDFFDALSMARCYRPAFPDATVREMLLAERGKAFDPAIVDMVIERWEPFVALRNRVTASCIDFRDLIQATHQEWSLA
ncbi:MAG: HD domain-containing protein [Variovorax sp.]|jgi:putative two-component system response regulator|nr:MAG: HD domain-containing protein [Variovorax sp.]